MIYNLYFPTEIETLGLAVRWETESYRWVQTDGIITDEAREMAPLDMTVLRCSEFMAIKSGRWITLFG